MRLVYVLNWRMRASECESIWDNAYEYVCQNDEIYLSAYPLFLYVKIKPSCYFHSFRKNW